MTRDIWGVFHDGVLKLVDGTVPGTIRLEIEIAYLRNMFPEPGNSFFVTLLDCSKLVYAEYGKQSTESLSHIQGREPEVLYVKSEEPLVLNCAMGSLQLDYAEMIVTLESGARSVTSL